MKEGRSQVHEMDPFNILPRGWDVYGRRGSTGGWTTESAAPETGSGEGDGDEQRNGR